MTVDNFMARQLTKHTFYQYLTCPAWVYFDAHHTEERTRPSLLARLQEDGLLDDQHRALVESKPDLIEITEEDPAEAFRKTLEAMRAGRGQILHGTLLDGHWVGTPDLLERVEGASRLGSYYYVAVDFKRHFDRESLDLSRLQGCFYADLLSRIQGTKPMFSYVILPTGEVKSHDLPTLEGEYTRVVMEIERLLAGNRPEHLFSSRCKHSPWFDACTDLAHHERDLTLLNRVAKEEVLALEEMGIKTVDQLALVELSRLVNALPQIRVERLVELKTQADAFVRGVAVIRTPVSLPGDAQNALFFDVEQHPLRNLTYLLGILKVENGAVSYHPFVAKTADEEREMWEQFQDFWTEYRHVPVFHYGTFEAEVVKRFSDLYGLCDELKGVPERRLFDILPVLRSSIVFPIPFYSLKDIASLVGFHWRDPDASGAHSVLWSESWLIEKNEAAGERILAYNEDDVVATRVVVEWVRDRAQKPGEERV